MFALLEMFIHVTSTVFLAVLSPSSDRIVYLQSRDRVWHTGCPCGTASATGSVKPRYCNGAYLQEYKKNKTPFNYQVYKQTKICIYKNKENGIFQLKYDLNIYSCLPKTTLRETSSLNKIPKTPSLGDLEDTCPWRHLGSTSLVFETGELVFVLQRKWPNNDDRQLARAFKYNDTECHFIDQIVILLWKIPRDYDVEDHGQRRDQATVLEEVQGAVHVWVQLHHHLLSHVVLQEAHQPQHACSIDLTSFTRAIWPWRQQNTIKCILTYSEQHTTPHK